MQSHRAEKRPVTPIGDAPYLNHAAAAERSKRHAWRIAWAQLVIIIIELGIIAYLSGQIIVLPYVVRITDGQSVSAVGIVPTTFDMAKDPGVVDHLLRLWISWVRGITTDPVAWQKQWEQAEAFMTPKAKGMLREFKQQQKARGDLGKAVTVEILHTQPLAGTNGRTWEIDFRETTYSTQGYVLKEESGLWHATVKAAQLPTKALKTPADFANPLRVFAEELSWGQRTKTQ
jgi:type IV secretory pathway TrbF-like protein